MGPFHRRDILGNRDAFRLTFKRGLIADGETWMERIRSRGLTSPTYNEAVARTIFQSIHNSFFGEFVKLQARLKSLKTQSE